MTHLEPDNDATLADPAAQVPATAAEQVRYFRRYRVERELGRGGMGVVMLAHDEELNIPVALKLLPETVAGDAEGIMRFKTEVLRGMTLSHPGIVRVHTFERDQQRAAIVMEFVRGTTLADLKAQQEGHCFDCAEILPWIEQLCVALDYAHGEAHVAHRDLKPRNIMLTPEGRVKITDFGLASMLTESLTRVATKAHAEGTPPYMSPQQVLGKPATRVDDLYAVGASIYDLLTSRPPFFRGDVFAQVLHETAPSMAQRRSELGITGKAEIPPAWEHAVAGCLAKDAPDRPQSGAALLAMLREAVVEKPAMVTVRVPRRKTAPAPAASPAPEPAQTCETTRTIPIVVTESQPTTPKPIPVSSPFRFVEVLRQRPTSGPMKFVADLVTTLVLSAVAAGGVQFIRHRAASQAAAAAAPVPVQTPAPQRPTAPSRLQGSKLDTSSLDSQPANGRR